jgi:hypothetical protein
MHYMILMSKKVTSQKKLGEIKSVPYNKPHVVLLGGSMLLAPHVVLCGLRTTTSQCSFRAFLAGKNTSSVLF